jgi:DNA-binding HxlR family transcriptional regulator
MSFQRLRTLSLARRELLPFVSSLEEHDILIAIGAADEARCPVGFKQLGLAPPSTLQRRLKKLLANRIIKKAAQRIDGRRVAYSLTARTLLAYEQFILQSFH